MNALNQKTTQETKVPRPPVVAVMGHVDHGKSTLLDYIRKTDIAGGEAGGITQKIGAYEVSVPQINADVDADKRRLDIGEKNRKTAHKITFLDTPGHEAFGMIRSRCTSVADIAILVVSAEDGVMPQTMDAYSCIKKSGLPLIVAINKIDKPNADLERTKGSLAENEIYLEGYGGDIPWVATSAKAGTGIPELLELIDLVAEMNEISGDPSSPASGFIVEADRDPRRGPAATAVITNGTLRIGETVVAGETFASIKIMENDKGQPIKEALMGTPVRIIGWSSLPEAGLPFVTVNNKKEAEKMIDKNHSENVAATRVNTKTNKNLSETKFDSETEILQLLIPVIVKADATGTIDAIVHELKKIESDRVKIKVINSGVGNISENDAKIAESAKGAVIIGFNVAIDKRAETLIERGAIEVKLFDVIYKLSEWLIELATLRTPKIKTEENQGVTKILKLFGKDKDKQIIGGKVIDGKIAQGDDVKIQRRESEIGRGRIRELQRQKVKVDEVATGMEFGALIESKITIAEGDVIVPFRIVEK